jgi:hypothetical protein
MATRRLQYFLAVTIYVATLAYAAPQKVYAAYDYIAPQVAPAVASNLTMGDLESILNETEPNPPYFVAYQLTTTDGSGAIASAAPLKVVPTDHQAYPYLAVFHNQINSTQFATYLGYSGDLRVWSTLGQIHSPASQPDMRILPDDSVLYAEEYNPSGRPYVRVHYYGNNGTLTGLHALIANPGLPPTNAITLPGTLLATADGTPEFGRITYTGAILSSKIEIPHHYYDRLTSPRRDLESVGTLTNFKTWSDSTDTTTNNLVTGAGGTGKIGDREVFKVGSTVYELLEAQIGPAGNYYDTWRLFLVNKTAGIAHQLHPALSGGAQSLGNPTISFVTLPNSSAPAIVFTCFVFGIANGTTPPGGHILVYRLQ